MKNQEIIQIDAASNVINQGEINPDTLFKRLNKALSKLRNKKFKSNLKLKKLTSVEIEKLLAECKSLIPNFYPVVLLGASTDLRLMEILSLKVEDIDFKNRIITVNGRLTSRNIKIEDNVAETIKNYIKNYGRKSGVIFRNVLGKSISRVWVFDNFKKLLKLCGFGASCYHFHSLRILQLH